MGKKPTNGPFEYKQVLQKTGMPPAIFDLARAGVDKPEGFRIPLIYFSWAILRGSRNLHHHPDNDEFLVVLEGEATVRLYGPGKPNARYEGVFEMSVGDVVLFPQGWVHSLEEKGAKGSAKVLVVFNNQDFKSIEDSADFVLPNDTDLMHLGENG